MTDDQLDDLIERARRDAAARFSPEEAAAVLTAVRLGAVRVSFGDFKRAWGEAVQKAEVER